MFEHVGAETFNGSLLCLKRGGRLVTCGSTSGLSTTINLMQLFQQQYRIIGSFGATMRNIRESLDKMAAGLTPVIDTEFPLADYAQGLARLESRTSSARSSSCSDGDASASIMSLRGRRVGRQLKAGADAVLGGLAVGMLRTPARPTDRTAAWRFRRRLHAHTSARQIERASDRPRQPRKQPFRINQQTRSKNILRGAWDNLGRVAAEFAHIDRLQIFEPGPSSRRRPIVYSPETDEGFQPHCPARWQAST